MDISKIPKVELHCHLDGIINPEILENEVFFGLLKDFSLADFKNLYPVKNYDEFWQWFAMVEELKRDPDLFVKLIPIHLQNLKKQNVHYTEVKYPAASIPNDRGAMLEKFQKFKEVGRKQKDDDCQFEILVALGRHRPLEALQDWADKICVLFEEDLIVGVSLAGPEPGYPVKPLQKVFQKLKDRGMGITIHAGEWCGVEAIHDAMEYGYPDRLGHGLAVFKHPQLLDFFAEQKLHLEFCPTSNIITGCFQHISEHPIKTALDYGLNFSINTDDPGVFNCSMDSEFQLVHDAFAFGEKDFNYIYDCSLQAAFRSQTAKK
ncbi:hypothetical protein ACFL35_17590 [Candidatus Riflebacteria bacterium]